jgi:hypothetical protein
MVGFLIFYNAKNVELLFIKFANFLKVNLNVNILSQKIKILSFSINGDNVALIPVLIVQYAELYV